MLGNMNACSIRYITTAPGVKGYVSADPIKDYRGQLSDWSNKDAVSKGWWIDTPPFSESFYADPKGTYAYTSKKGAILWDYPSLSVEGYGRAKDIGAQFYTIAIGWTKDKTPEYLGGVYWGFYIDNNQVVKFDPAKPDC
jgi:hypothetical protein